MQRLLGDRPLNTSAIVLVVAGIVLAVLSLIGLDGAWALEVATLSVALGLVLIAIDRRPRGAA